VSTSGPAERPQYRTWIRSTRLAVFAALSGVCLGASIAEFGTLADLLALPFPLRHPKVLGQAMLMVGTKPPHTLT